MSEKERGEKKLSISNISTIINVDGDDLVLLIVPKKVYKNSKNLFSLVWFWVCRLIIVCYKIENEVFKISEIFYSFLNENKLKFGFKNSDSNFLVTKNGFFFCS